MLRVLIRRDPQQARWLASACIARALGADEARYEASQRFVTSFTTRKGACHA